MSGWGDNPWGDAGWGDYGDIAPSVSPSLLRLHVIPSLDADIEVTQELSVTGFNITPALSLELSIHQF